MHLYSFGAAGQPSNFYFNHNFYMYAAFEDARIWPVPWDLDITFSAANAVAIQAEWNDLEAECLVIASPLASLGVPSHLPPTCDPLIRSWARQSDAYRAIVEELLDGPFSEGAVEAKLARWAAQIAPMVAEDAAADLDLSVDRWEASLERLRGELAERRAAMAASIGR